MFTNGKYWVIKNIRFIYVPIHYNIFFRYVLSSIFVPGDRHVVTGHKDGKLLIIDIAAGDILEEIAAHKSEIWSICLSPDLVSFHTIISSTFY